MIKTIQQINIGILGGGQLGRMLIQNAINLNLNISVLDPDKDAPCRHLVKKFTLGDLNDYDTVYDFGKDKDLIFKLSLILFFGKKFTPCPYRIEPYRTLAFFMYRFDR